MGRCTLQRATWLRATRAGRWLTYIACIAQCEGCARHCCPTYHFFFSMSSYVLSIARLVQLSYMLAVASHLRLAHLCHLSGLQELRWLPMTSVAIPYPRFLTTFASLIFAAIGNSLLPATKMSSGCPLKAPTVCRMPLISLNCLPSLSERYRIISTSSMRAMQVKSTDLDFWYAQNCAPPLPTFAIYVSFKIRLLLILLLLRLRSGGHPSSSC